MNTYSYAYSNSLGYYDSDGQFIFVALGVASLGLSLYDAYNTLTDDCLTSGDKAARLAIDAAIGLVDGAFIKHGLKVVKALRGATKGGVNDLVKAAGGKARSSGDIVVDGGSKKAKNLFRQFDAKGPGNRGFKKDKKGGGRQVIGETAKGDALRIRFKPDGTTRIQAGKQKFIFPKPKK